MLSGGFKAAAIAAARRRRSGGDEKRTNPERAARASERGGDDGGGGGGGSILSWVLGRPTAASAAEAEAPPPLDSSPTTGRKASTIAGLGVDGKIADGHDDDKEQLTELWNETAEGGGGLSQYADGTSSDDNDDASSVAGGDTEGEEEGGEGGEACADGGWADQARVQDLLGESRRLDADSLRALLRALIAIVHGSLPFHERRRRDSEEEAGVMGSGEREGSGGGEETAEAADGFFEAVDGFRGVHPQRQT